MENNIINGIIEKLSGIENIYDELIRKYRDETGCRIIMSPFTFIPPEINSAFNIITLKIPEFIMNTPDYNDRINSLCDAVIIPGNTHLCAGRIVSVDKKYIFNTPSGFGEDASVNLHNEILEMLKTLFQIDLKTINIETLQKNTAIYETLRRTIRNITSLREEDPALLNNPTLSLIFETAQILPPESAIEYLFPLLDEIKSVKGSNEKKMLKAMLYGGRQFPAAIADQIEQMGILIAEDDSCSGRRFFDISLNATSEYIFYELLDAYSYRPLTPCIRDVHERYELLYKLLRNYGIEAVIFFNDGECRESMSDIDFLRIRMMRDGIDPVLINSTNYREVINDYLSRA